METRSYIQPDQPKSQEQLVSSSGWESLCKNPDQLALVPRDTTLSIGFGVSNSLTPRVLAYPLLGLEMLRVNPDMKLEMYVASQFAQLQAVNLAQAENFELQLKQIINAFSKEFYGDIASKVSFAETLPITADQFDAINDLSQLLVNNAEVMTFVQRKAQTAQDIQQALAYIASHSLYMRDPLPINPNLFIVPLPDDGSQVTMIGGSAEEIMWSARQTILDQGEMTGGKPIQLFTSIGRMPPYYRKSNEPLFTDENMLQTIPEAMLLDGDLFRDYAYLTVAIARACEKDVPFEPLKATKKDRQTFLEQEFVGESLLKLEEFCHSFTHSS